MTPTPTSVRVLRDCVVRYDLGHDQVLLVSYSPSGRLCEKLETRPSLATQFAVDRMVARAQEWDASGLHRITLVR